MRGMRVDYNIDSPFKDAFEIMDQGRRAALQREMDNEERAIGRSTFEDRKRAAELEQKNRLAMEQAVYRQFNPYGNSNNYEEPYQDSRINESGYIANSPGNAPGQTYDTGYMSPMGGDSNRGEKDHMLQALVAKKLGVSPKEAYPAQYAQQQADIQSRQKSLEKKSEEISAKNVHLDHANKLKDLLADPRSKKILSDLSNSRARSISNYVRNSFLSPEDQQWLQEFDLLSKVLVSDAQKSSSGGTTNRYLSLIQSQKPGPHLSYSQNIATVEKMLETLYGDSERLEAEANFIHDGYAPHQASAMADLYIKQKKQYNKPEAQEYNKPEVQEYNRKPTGARERSISDEVANILGQGALSAADAFGGSLDSVMNLIPEGLEMATGYEIPRFRHMDLRNKKAEGVEKTAQNIGEFAGNMGALMLGGQVMPNIGARASNLLGKGVVRDIASAGLGGAVSGSAAGFAGGEGNRANAAASGGLFGGAIGTGSEIGKKVLNFFMPKSAVTSLYRDYRQDKTKYGKQMNDAIKEGEKIVPSIAPTTSVGTSNKIKNQIKYLEKNGYKKAADAINAYNQHPTLSSAKDVRSLLTKELSNIDAKKGTPGFNAQQILTGKAKQIEEAMENGLRDAGRPELWKMFKNASDSYAKEISPFLDNKNFQNFVKIYEKSGGNVSATESMKLIKELANDPTFLRQIGEKGATISDIDFINKHGEKILKSLAAVVGGVKGYEAIQSMGGLSPLIQESMQ